MLKYTPKLIKEITQLARRGATLEEIVAFINLNTEEKTTACGVYNKVYLFGRRDPENWPREMVKNFGIEYRDINKKKLNEYAKRRVEREKAGEIKGNRVRAEDRNEIHLCLLDFVMLLIEAGKTNYIDDVRKTILKAFRTTVRIEPVEKAIEECLSGGFIIKENGRYFLSQNEYVRYYVAFLHDRESEIFQRTGYKINRRFINRFLNYLENAK